MINYCYYIYVIILINSTLGEDKYYEEIMVGN